MLPVCRDLRYLLDILPNLAAFRAFTRCRDGNIICYFFLRLRCVFTSEMIFFKIHPHKQEPGLNNASCKNASKNSTHTHTQDGKQGPVSLRLMTSQFKDIVTHTQKSKTVKWTFCGVWVQNFVWNFKGALWNFTQNFEPIHRKICILQGSKNFTTYDILKLWHLKS